MRVTSSVRMNMGRIRDLTQASITALEKTAEALHTEVEQAQVMPFDTGTLQNESTFVDCSQSRSGKAKLISSTPYARRLYYHPEYHFQTKENLHAKGRWLEDWIPGGSREDFAPEAFKKFYKGEANV